MRTASSETCATAAVEISSKTAIPSRIAREFDDRTMYIFMPLSRCAGRSGANVPEPAHTVQKSVPLYGKFRASNPS